MAKLPELTDKELTTIRLALDLAHTACERKARNEKSPDIQQVTFQIAAQLKDLRNKI